MGRVGEVGSEVCGGKGEEWIERGATVAVCGGRGVWRRWIQKEELCAAAVDPEGGRG